MAGVITKTNDKAKKAVIQRLIKVFIIYPHVNGKGIYASETFADHKKRNYRLIGSHKACIEFVTLGARLNQCCD